MIRASAGASARGNLAELANEPFVFFDPACRNRAV
jgi:hypothetical protein